MRVLVFTVPGDFHSHAVKFSLERLGHQVDLFFITNTPNMGSISIFASNARGVKTFINDGNHSIELDSYDIVWTRRFYQPAVPIGLHPADREIAMADWKAVTHYIQFGLGLSTAFKVNPPSSLLSRSSKALQLHYAEEVGLDIPTTYIGTDKDSILCLQRICKEEGAEVIVKPLTRAHWVDQGGTERGFTTSVLTSKDLDEADISLSPAIYQKMIKKLFEVRVIAMGSTLLGFKLDSQKDTLTQLDYRKAVDWAALGNSPIKIPQSIRRKIISFMKKSDILFSALDFAVTHSGDWVFFESNEMGNWLWIEGAQSHVPLLDCFCQFLLSRDPEFDYTQRKFSSAIKLSDFTSNLALYRNTASIECVANIDVPIAGRIQE